VLGRLEHGVTDLSADWLPAAAGWPVHRGSCLPQPGRRPRRWTGDPAETREPFGYADPSTAASAPAAG